MGLYVRKVKTASGATAVQIASTSRGVRTIEEHIGSARDDAAVAALVSVARKKIQGDQLAFDFALTSGESPVGQPVVVSRRSRILWEVLENAYERIGLGDVGNNAFKQLVLGRVVEPTSKADTIRVLHELEVPQVVSLRTVWRTLATCVEKNWRDKACQKLYAYATQGQKLHLVLYDVTTLYFEIDEEDDLRKVGMSKERRVDPQIVVGLLTTSTGFPLEIHAFEGNTAETLTLIPVLESFRKRHELAEVVVVADAGMLSASNLNRLEDSGFRFIVGSRISKAPYDLAEHFEQHGTEFVDGQTIECFRKMGQGEGLRSRRVVYQFSQARKRRDVITLDKQVARAESVASNKTPGKKERFVKHTDNKKSVDTTLVEKARHLVGLKGYVTNIAENTMSGPQIVTTYHELFQIERSFRMAKNDLRARPIFHHRTDSINAHLTIVFTALGIARDLEQRTGVSIQRIVRTLKPLQDTTINITGQYLTAITPPSPDALNILSKLNSQNGH
jgi:hypothetical protein